MRRDQLIPLLILGLLKKTGLYGYELMAIMNEQNYESVVNYIKGSCY